MNLYSPMTTVFISPMTAVFIIKFGPDRRKTVGVVFCNFQRHISSVLTKIHSIIKFLNFGRSPKQLQTEFPRNQHTYNKVWLKWNENCAPNDPKPNTRNHASKVPFLVHCSTPSPKFSSVSLYNQLFSRYCTV